jgi:hypothetical protein
LEDLVDLVPKEEFQREVRLRKQVERQQKSKSAAPARSKSAKRTMQRRPRRAKAK